jgi:hydrophobin
MKVLSTLAAFTAVATVCTAIPAFEVSEKMFRALVLPAYEVSEKLKVFRRQIQIGQPNPNPSQGGGGTGPPKDVCFGTTSNALCCAVDILGLADLNCENREYLLAQIPQSFI